MLKNLAMCLRRTCISLESAGDVEDIIVEWFIKLLCEREKGLGSGVQEGFVVASVDRVVGRFREANGGVRKALDETEEHRHAVESCGEGDEGRDDERCVGRALNLESCEKCHNIRSCFVGLFRRRLPARPTRGGKFPVVGAPLWANTEAAGIVEVEK